ncbi:MAG: hypothetical protein ACFCBV_12365 [Phycisphaerales bacterium]
MTPSITGISLVLGFVALCGVMTLPAARGNSESQSQQARPIGPTEVALPATHFGDWAGPNRLWTVDPNAPVRSDGTASVEAKTVRYSWSRGEDMHEGVLVLAGQPGALSITWQDTFHSKEPMTLNGFQHEGVVRVFGTYPSAEGQPDWGWQIELDTRDREAFVMRMFNVVPGIGPMPAVVLHGTR